MAYRAQLAALQVWVRIAGRQRQRGPPLHRGVGVRGGGRPLGVLLGQPERLLLLDLAAVARTSLGQGNAELHRAAMIRV